MDPKIARLVAETVDHAVKLKDPDLNTREPDETRMARFANALVDAETQRGLLADIKNPGPPILTPMEIEEIRRVLTDIDAASGDGIHPGVSEDAGGWLDTLKARFLGDDEASQDSEVFDRLAGVLLDAASDDLREGTAAPDREFTTADGRYEVSVGSDGSLTFRDTETDRVYEGPVED